MLFTSPPLSGPALYSHIRWCVHPRPPGLRFILTTLVVCTPVTLACALFSQSSLCAPLAPRACAYSSQPALCVPPPHAVFRFLAVAMAWHPLHLHSRTPLSALPFSAPGFLLGVCVASSVAVMQTVNPKMEMDWHQQLTFTCAPGTWHTCAISADCRFVTSPLKRQCSAHHSTKLRATAGIASCVTKRQCGHNIPAAAAPVKQIIRASRLQLLTAVNYCSATSALGTQCSCASCAVPRAGNCPRRRGPPAPTDQRCKGREGRLRVIATAGQQG